MDAWYTLHICKLTQHVSQGFSISIIKDLNSMKSEENFLFLIYLLLVKLDSLFIEDR